MKPSKIVWSVIVGLTCLTFLSCGQSKENGSAPDAQNTDTVDVNLLYFQTDLSRIPELSKSDTLTFDMVNAEEDYQLIINRIQESIPGIMAISARVENIATGSASLIFREGTLSGFIDISKTNKRLQVMYDSSGTYYLREVLPEDRNELEGSAPLTPPKDGN